MASRGKNQFPVPSNIASRVPTAFVIILIFFSFRKPALATFFYPAWQINLPRHSSLWQQEYSRTRICSIQYIQMCAFHFLLPR